MWVIAVYEASTLFTLKPASATSSGGKTLLVPTPYSIKMALLDVACRLDGQATGSAAWEWLRTVGIALLPSEQVVVNNTFAKVLKPRREDAVPGKADAGFFQRTIAYREYAYLHGAFGIAVSTDTDAQAEWIARWLTQLNYLGRRGCFIQLIDLPQIFSDLPTGYFRLDSEIEGFHLDTVLTQLDDAGEDTTFTRVSIYSNEKIRLGADRVLRHIELPYRRVGSSRGYTHYRRVDLDDDV